MTCNLSNLFVIWKISLIMLARSCKSAQIFMQIYIFQNTLGKAKSSKYYINTLPSDTCYIFTRYILYMYV